ncbi:MAG TPA: response regulator [Thermoplasmata archaeon]|nr:response regulator [Thermoplasmata archaeon]
MEKGTTPSRGRILIVDDVELNRKLLRAHLRAAGLETIEAADGSEALRLLLENSVDAVVSDILMPNMDGYRLCFEIRSNADLRHLPFVVYSATYTNADDERLALEAGANLYFRKPDDTQELVRAVIELVTKDFRLSAPTHGTIRPDSPTMKLYDENLVRELLERTERLAEGERKYRKIVEQLFRHVGRGASAVLYGAGMEAAGEAFDRLQAIWRPQNDDEFVSAFRHYLRLGGLGDLGEVKIDRQRGTIRMSVANAFEVGLHEHSSAPKCHFLRGLLAGIGSKFLKIPEGDCVETSCGSLDSSPCTFLVKPLFAQDA